MKQISFLLQQEIMSLRHSGLSHRDISSLLNVSLGSVFKYSDNIKISHQQHSNLKNRSFKKFWHKESIRSSYSWNQWENERAAGNFRINCIKVCKR